MLADVSILAMTLPPCTFDRETKRAVCRAYKAEYAEGWREQRRIDAGVRAFTMLHPEVSRADAGQAVALIIAIASRDYPGWCIAGLRNVPYYRVPREYGGQPEGFLTVTTDEYRAGKVR
jgi:hypothetical protein